MKKGVHLLGVLFLLFLVGGTGNAGRNQVVHRDYRQEMRQFVQQISQYAKGQNPNFIIIPQNGQELLTLDGEGAGLLAKDYLAVIDGVGREDLFYGYTADNRRTPADETEYMLEFLKRASQQGVEVLVTDYCWKASYVERVYAQGLAHGFISFVAPDRELNQIPGQRPHQAHQGDVTRLAEVKNFLYLLNPDEYTDRTGYLEAIRQTDYDLVIIDLFYEDEPLTAEEVASLQVKANGGTRLVIAYMSIGEAEDYRYYWQEEWERHAPDWLQEMNPDWEGNYKVCYWDLDWQALIYGNKNSYLDQILIAGFDGVYLDIIDAFEYFEED